MYNERWYGDSRKTTTGYPGAATRRVGTRCFTTTAAAVTVALACTFGNAGSRNSAAALWRAGRADRNPGRQSRFVAERKRAVQSRFDDEARNRAHGVADTRAGPPLRHCCLDRRPVGQNDQLAQGKSLHLRP